MRSPSTASPDRPRWLLHQQVLARVGRPARMIHILAHMSFDHYPIRVAIEYIIIALELAYIDPASRRPR